MKVELDVEGAARALVTQVTGIEGWDRYLETTIAILHECAQQAPLTAEVPPGVEVDVSGWAAAVAIRAEAMLRALAGPADGAAVIH